MSTIKLAKKRDPIIKAIPIPDTEAQRKRYFKLLNELDEKGFESLHEKARERLNELMDEVELELAKSS